MNIAIPIQFNCSDVIRTGLNKDVALLPFQPPNSDVVLGMDLISNSM